MESIYHFLHNFLFSSVDLVSTVIEIWGLLLIVIAMTKEIYRVVFKYHLDFRKVNADNSLNAGLASALEVLLASEILKTITIDSYQNLIIIGILVFLRIAMAMLLIWEHDHKVEVPHHDDFN